MFTLIDTGTGSFQENDITLVIEELGPNDILNLFGSLGLKQDFINRKRNAERSELETQAKQVLMGWIQQKTPTLSDLLKALEETGNNCASEELQKKWGISSKLGIVK